MHEALALKASAPDAAAPAAAQALRYGLFALPLAFAALPLYVQWPAHAALAWGMPLAVVGALLLAVRVLDAFVDPWIGARIDALFARSTRLAWVAAGAAAVLIACGITALMFAPAAVVASSAALLAWAAVALVLTSGGYSIAMVTHQAWAVRLGGAAPEQARWVGAREGLALVGVIVASVLPTQVGWAATVVVLALLLCAGWLALLGVQPPPASRLRRPVADAAAPNVAPQDAPATPPGSASEIAAPINTAAHMRGRGEPVSPWRVAGFRRLMMVMVVSGLASAIPASLVVLYVRDLLQAGAAAEGWLLGLYFAAAALGMPLWVRAIRRFGLVRPWLLGMGLSIVAFAGAAALGPGDLALFTVICLASGLALGADLVVPPALLAGLIQRQAAPAGVGAPGIEGLWFGWWNFALKLTLAGAAGLALPLVQWLGYSPGARSDAALVALAFCYAGLPCLAKAAAAALLWRHRGAWPWAEAATYEPTENP